MLNIEIWKNCPEPFTNYEVSNRGRVRNRFGHIVSQWFINSGYLCVTLTSSHKRKRNLLVHRLVAEAFLENQEELETVNHKDGRKTHNALSNLEWLSMADNLKHARETGLNIYNKPTAGMKLKPRNPSSPRSQYIGVSWDKGRNQWRSCLVLNGKVHSQKRFNTETDAAEHYDSLVRLHGADRPTNFN